MQILLSLFNLLLEILHQLVSLLGVELRDADHADIEEFFNILPFHLANEFCFERLQGLIHKRNQFLLICSRFVAFLFIDTILDEDALQRGVEILFLKFGLLYLQLPLEQGHRVVGGFTQ